MGGMKSPDPQKFGEKIRSPPQSFGRVFYPQNAVKVIKGEIHNVLNVMRADARYSSPQRFMQELPLDEHPLLLQLRELHEKLSLLELRQEEPKLVWYITPFCTAISGRDISASITGAALSALHKFLLYGFITPETPGASEGMTLVAKCILHCTFEQSNNRATKASTMSRSVTYVQDEEVVLKLLSLSALVARCSLLKAGETPLLDASLLLGLLDTCLHVSHRAQEASPLLKSAAGDALGQIVLVIFGTREDDGQEDTREEDISILLSRSAILSKLASLVNPLDYSDDTCVTSLTLINIALETMRHKPSAAEVAILQNDLCKHLLQWSTTSDLLILSLALRVIFNLFQSIRDHLKVPLEVFLTSVHLRILDPSSSCSNEQREVVLESLLEFCAEPALMQDLYRNYDCDVHCTNLFETICTTLARVVELPGDDIAPFEPEAPRRNTPINALNRLAIEGILTVIDSIARRCQGPGGTFRPPTTPQSSLTDVSDTESDNSSVNIGETITDGLGWEAASSEEAQILLQQRKRKKYWLGQVATEFNRRPMGKEWIQVAERSGVLASPAEAKAIASFLYTTPHLDKTQMGLYLSKGPASKYPFHDEVRTSFVSLFDFRGMSFSKALRTFLKKFRLPGEAQCIDRLMEAFSAQLYEQQQTAEEPSDEQVSEHLSKNDEESVRRSQLMPFRSADAVFVLSFSTIMLNTDLHNPTIKDERRMTLEQFVRNNRGINDGEDLPEQFLTELYQQIQEEEIQVQTELSDVVHRSSFDGGGFHSAHWDGLLSKSDQVSKPFFTPADAARRTVFQAGVHERDMFLAISESCIQCISSVFVRSYDDVLVVKALKGFKQIAKIAVYFSMDVTLNEILQILLDHGRDYIMGCIVLEYSDWNDGAFVSSGSTNSDVGEEDSDDETEYEDPLLDSGSPVPQSLMASNSSSSDPDVMYQPTHPEWVGSAGHRGLLALDCAFKLVRKHTVKLCEAWPVLIECICALRDARALPEGLADLDDFADSNGQILPLSPFARRSQERLDRYYMSLAGQDGANDQGWFKISSFFKKESLFSQTGGPLGRRQSLDNAEDESSTDPRSSVSNWLLCVAKAADLKQVVLMRANQLPLAKQTIRALLDAIDVRSCGDDPVFEHHAVFSLELAARAFFSNRDRALELFPMFLSKFEELLGGSSGTFAVPEGGGDAAAPFLMERVIVTILRSCIHLYDIAEMRPLLRTSLFLLIGLPAQFTRFIADRISCGMAILLRGSFYLFETANEWNFIGDMLDSLSHFGPGRGFVFDGIAATVEYALPMEAGTDDPSMFDQRSPENLSFEGCAAFAELLTRFANGCFQSDLSMQVPAVHCLEKVYRRMLQLMVSPQHCEEDAKEPQVATRDYNLWESVAKAFYTVSLSDDAGVSQQGCECFQRFLLVQEVDRVPDERWLALLDIMIAKKPPVTSEVARVHTFSLLAKVLLITIAHLSHRKENWEKLSEAVTQTAVLVGENLREGRRGTVSPLFERTLQTVTYMCNHMVTGEFGGDEAYSQWASETLLLELEKVGASGGSFKNVAAISKPVPGSQRKEESTLGPVEADNTHVAPIPSDSTGS